MLPSVCSLGCAAICFRLPLLFYFDPKPSWGITCCVIYYHRNGLSSCLSHDMKWIISRKHPNATDSLVLRHSVTRSSYFPSFVPKTASIQPWVCRGLSVPSVLVPLAWSLVMHGLHVVEAWHPQCLVRNLAVSLGQLTFPRPVKMQRYCLWSFPTLCLQFVLSLETGLIYFCPSLPSSSLVPACQLALQATSGF